MNGGNIQITVSGNLAGKGADQDGEHKFVAHCLDSTLAQNLLILSAQDFIHRVRDNLSLREWSPLAIQAGAGAGVAVVSLDTLRASPASMEMKEVGLHGTIAGNQDMVRQIAEFVHEQRAQEKRSLGFHRYGFCDPSGESACSKCSTLAGSFGDLPERERLQLASLVHLTLVALQQRGLLP